MSHPNLMAGDFLLFSRSCPVYSPRRITYCFHLSDLLFVLLLSCPLRFCAVSLVLRSYFPPLMLFPYSRSLRKLSNVLSISSPRILSSDVITFHPAHFSRPFLLCSRFHLSPAGSRSKVACPRDRGVLCTVSARAHFGTLAESHWRPPKYSPQPPEYAHSGGGRILPGAV